MNRPKVRTLKGSDFIDLEAWWAELGKSIDLLADFDYLARHNPTKLTKEADGYTLTLFEDRVDGRVYGTKRISLLGSGVCKVILQIGQSKEIWQLTRTPEGFRKEKVNA